MSGTKDMWLDEQERICDEYASGGMDMAEAHKALIRMGFDTQEATDLLENSVS